MDYFDCFDWATTPLGPRSEWSSALKTTYDIMMSSGFAMCAMWGNEKTFIYNRAYAPFLGKRHPAALGQHMPDVWHDVWHQISPIIDRAMAGESVYMENLHLVMTRNDFEEDTFWTFSYSPLRDDHGRVVGFLDVVTDVTETTLLRKSMQEKNASLAESEGRLLKLVTAGAYSLFRMSADWSEMWQLGDRAGVDDDHSASIDWMDKYILEADRAEVMSAIQQAVASKATLELEHRVKLEHGRWKWVLSRAVPILNEKGQIVEWFGAASDISARKQAEEQQQVVNQEVGHRLKNILSIVQSIVSQTLRNAPDLNAANRSLTERLSALARAQNILLSGHTLTTDLRTLIKSAIAHSDQEQRVTLSGPGIIVAPAAALNLTLTINELATNAIKYGALRDKKGEVSVEWSADGEHLALCWTESGGPVVTEPQQKGFGSRLIERSLIGGEAGMVYAPTGLIYTLKVPLINLNQH